MGIARLRVALCLDNRLCCAGGDSDGPRKASCTPICGWLPLGPGEGGCDGEAGHGKVGLGAVALRGWTRFTSSIPQNRSLVDEVLTVA